MSEVWSADSPVGEKRHAPGTMPCPPTNEAGLHAGGPVLDLQVAEDELIQRLLKRGEESGRSDDNLETIQKRLDVYHAQTAPIAEHYAKKGVHHAIEGSGSIADITARIAKVVNALN